MMLDGITLTDVLVDFVLESHDGLGGAVEASIWGDPIMLLKSSNSLTIIVEVAPEPRRSFNQVCIAKIVGDPW